MINSCFQLRSRLWRCSALLLTLASAHAAAPTATLVGLPYLGASQITVTVQSSETGRGYLTLLAAGATAGSGAQTKAGQDSGSQPAFRTGSLPLTENSPANYTFRNLTESTDYTVCFTAEDAATVLSPTVETVLVRTVAPADLSGIDWTTVGSSISAGSAMHLSVAIAPDGMPWVACQDDGSSPRAGVVKRFDGKSWITMGTGGPLSDRVTGTALAFAPDGTAYLAYGEGSAAIPTVAKLMEGEWTAVGGSLSANAGSHLSLSFAPDGTPYVAFCDQPSGAASAKATVKKFDGSQWLEVGAPGGLSAAGAAYTSLAFAPDGTPWVAFADPDAAGSLTVMKLVGSGWTVVGTPGICSGASAYVSLAFAPDGTPHVAFRDDANASGATVMKHANAAPSGWTLVGSSSFSGAAVYDTSLAFAPDGSVYVGYNDVSPTGGATVKRYDGSGSTGWVNVGRAGFSGINAYYVRFAIGPDGGPFVAYIAEGTGYKATVMGIIPDRAPTDIALSPASVVQTPGSNVVGGTLSTVDAFDTGAHTYELVAGDGDADNASFSVLESSLRANNPAALAARPHTVRVRTADSGGLVYEKALTVTVVVPPQLRPIVTRDVGANQVTLVLQSSVTGRGYFTLVPETSATTGTGVQTAAGQGSDGSPAFRFGSLPLTANTDGLYTVRNLIANTTYTIRFTADDGVALQPVPAIASFRTRVATNLTTAEWVQVGSANMFEDRVSTSLAIASDGTPFVAFEEFVAASGFSKTRVSKFDGSAWVVVGNPAAPGFSSGETRGTKLALAPDGTPWVAFWDGGHAGKITVMAFMNGTWSVVGSPGFSAGTDVGDISLGFAPDGVPFVAYCEVVAPLGRQAAVMKLRAGEWELVGDLASFSRGADRYTSLGFGPDGVPCVAYVGGDGGGTKVMKFSAPALGGWVMIGTDGFSGSYNGDTALAFAPDGALFVVTGDFDYSGRATVKKLHGGFWSLVGSPGFSANRANTPSLAFGADGTPYLAYVDYDITTFVSRAVVMRFDGVGWTAAGTLSAPHASGWNLSFSLAPDGSPYIAYPETVTYGTTVMKLIDTTAPRVSSITRQNPTTLKTDADTLVFRVTFSEAVQNVSPDDFAITGTTATVTAATSAGGSAYDVTVSGGDLPDLRGTVALSFAVAQNIQSVAGSRALSHTVPTGANDNTYEVAQNTMPTFVGAVTTLTVAQSSTATNIRPLLAVSDTDTGQTLTWSQSSAPSHGTLTITGATALSGGTSLTSGGTITYRPIAGYAGADSFVIRVSDGKAAATRTITVTVTAPTITVSPASMPTATVGVTFSQPITASGGISPYSYAVTGGALPAGLTLSSTGALSGKPTADGVFNFTISATDKSTGDGPFAASGAYSLTVNAPTLSLSPSLPAPVLGMAYSQTLEASGGTAPHSYAVTGGSLPAGLSLANTGALTGTPSASGAFSFAVTATDSSTGNGPFTVNQTYSGTVSAPTIAVAALTAPTAATVGVSYSRTITASGGNGPYTYVVTVGALPPGLSLWSDGVLKGTPTAGGTFSFTVTATDSSAAPGPFTGARAYALIVNKPTISVSPWSWGTPAPRVGDLYSRDLTASGGTAPYVFTVSGGTLPPGLSLSTGGVLSGTPTAGGTFSFTVLATDSSTGVDSPYSGTRAYRTSSYNALTVNSPTIVVGPPSLEDAVAGVSYDRTITATGGTPDYSFAVTTGILPAGLELSGSGELSGTPSVSGTFSFTVKATDSSTGTGPYTASRAYTLGIAPAVSSIVRSNPNPSNAASVDFTVTFSGSVSGVDASDCALSTLGLTGAMITSITGSGSTYTVTVNSGSGDGTLRLDVLDDDSIRGANSMPLGGAGVGNGGFTTGQTYTIDRTAPTTTVETAVFSADTGRSANDFITATAVQTISGTISAPIAADEVVQVSLDGGTVWADAITVLGSTAWSIDAQTLVASNTLRVRVADAAGNVSAVFGQPYILDTVAPAPPPIPGTASAATTNRRPAITGTAEAGSVVALYDRASLIGSVVATDGTWTITPAGDLGPGLHLLTVTATDIAGNTSGASPALSLRIDADAGFSPHRQTITFGLLTDQSTAHGSLLLAATANSGLAVRFTVVSGPATISGNRVTLTGMPGVVTIRATQPGDGDYEAAASVERSFRVRAAPPRLSRPPTSETGAVLSAGCTGPGCTYQWQCNGAELSGATGPTLALDHCQASNGGLYAYTIVTPDGTAHTSDPEIVGLSTLEKMEGAAEEVLTDVVHPNGNVYDQLLLDGSAAALTANPGQITRISFIDLSNDIVQVEFSGAGTLSLVVDGVTVPAPAVNYHQPEVNYVRGHAGIVITGANETSNVSVFSVGRFTAVNQSLFRDGVAYDGVANVAFIAIQSANGKFGGVYTGNVEYFASLGYTGLYAPGVQFVGPVNIGDIQAFDTAQPVLVVGAVNEVRIAGGNLAQPNRQPIRVAGLTRVTMAPGQTSQGDALPAQPNQGVLQQGGVDVTDLIVAAP